MRIHHLLIGALAAYLAWGTYRHFRPDPHWPLVTTLDPSLTAEAKLWPPSEAQDSVTWQDDSRLMLERRWIRRQGSLVHTERIWIRFAPPEAPRVAIETVTENKAIDQSWGFYDVEGRAWISSDGWGLGRNGGPDLALRWEFAGKNGGSLDHNEGAVLLSSEQLRRD
jgi:hypothetical protein